MHIGGEKKKTETKFESEESVNEEIKKKGLIDIAMFSI